MTNSTITITTTTTTGSGKSTGPGTGTGTGTGNQPGGLDDLAGLNAIQGLEGLEAATLNPGLASDLEASQLQAPAAGLVTITDGQQLRSVWPVHLAGWLEAGWRQLERWDPALEASPADPLNPAAPTAAATEPLLSGLLTIVRGQEQRQVWPVHLAGWLEQGWQLLNGDAAPPAAAAVAQEPQSREPEAQEPPGPAAPPPEPGSSTADEDDDEGVADNRPRSTAPARRGRRRQSEPQQPAGAALDPAVTADGGEPAEALLSSGDVPTPVGTEDPDAAAITSSGTATATSGIATRGTATSSTATAAGTDHAAAASDALLDALPDDLLQGERF